MLLKHGMYGTRVYKIWSGMKDRCTNPNCPEYHAYGGRGISVCEEWNDAATFILWAIGNGYRDHLSIDRIDNDKGYSPENCRWATRGVQANNKSNNRLITIDGVTRTAAQWEDLMGLRRNIVHNRLHRGWSPECAVLVPVGAVRTNQFTKRNAKVYTERGGPQ